MGEEKTRLEADIVDAGRGERDRGMRAAMRRRSL